MSAGSSPISSQSNRQPVAIAALANCSSRISSGTDRQSRAARRASIDGGRTPAPGRPLVNRPARVGAIPPRPRRGNRPLVVEQPDADEFGDRVDQPGPAQTDGLTRR